MVEHTFKVISDCKNKPCAKIKEFPVDLVMSNWIKTCLKTEFYRHLHFVSLQLSFLLNPVRIGFDNIIHFL